MENKLSVERLEEIIGQFIDHYTCEEDTWYSCPKAEGGCANEDDGDECCCGRDDKISKIAKAIKAELKKHNGE